MQALQEYILANVTATDEQTFWVSGNDLVADGNYNWLGTGKPVIYAKWQPGEPNQFHGAEHCLMLNRDSKSMHMSDANCAIATNYICQANTPKTLSMTVW